MGTLIGSCLGLLVTSAKVDFSLACLFTWVLFLGFTSCVTPTNSLTGCMTASRIPYIPCFSAEVGCRGSNGRSNNQQADELIAEILLPKFRREKIILVFHEAVTYSFDNFFFSSSVGLQKMSYLIYHNCIFWIRSTRNCGNGSVSTVFSNNTHSVDSEFEGLNSGGSRFFYFSRARQRFLFKFLKNCLKSRTIWSLEGGGPQILQWFVNTSWHSMLKADLLRIVWLLWHMKILWISWLPYCVQLIKISLLISESSIDTEITRIYSIWLIECKGQADMFHYKPDNVCNCCLSKSPYSFHVDFEVEYIPDSDDAKGQRYPTWFDGIESNQNSFGYLAVTNWSCK